MEGSLFVPPNRPNRQSEQICTECGQSFRPRQIADGAEELCDICYQAQFEPPRHMPRWQAHSQGRRPGGTHA